VTLQTNVHTIVGAIRAFAPTAEIIVMGIYDPLFPAVGSVTDFLTAQVNNAIQAGIVGVGAFFANPFPALNLNPAYPNELASICSLTAVCGPLHDIHPTDAGYADMAGVVWNASGYAGLS
jgi:hypothetical protein